MNPFQFSIDNGRLTIGKCFLFFLLLLSGNIFSQNASDSVASNPFKSMSANPALHDSVVYISLSDSSQKKDSSFTALAAKDSIRKDSILTVAKSKKHSPLKAALFSLAVPGLGQAYNKKYWKIPIVYAGFGGLSYAIYHTATNFHGYRRAYRAQVADPPDYTASYKGVSDQSTLKSYRDYYKRYLDISVICFSLWHVLNIVDATVDAHLFDWNMRDDLSVSWRPAIVATPTNYSAAAAGVQVQMRF